MTAIVNGIIDLKEHITIAVAVITRGVNDFGHSTANIRASND